MQTDQEIQQSVVLWDQKYRPQVAPNLAATDKNGQLVYQWHLDHGQDFSPASITSAVVDLKALLDWLQPHQTAKRGSVADRLAAVGVAASTRYNHAHSDREEESTNRLPSILKGAATVANDLVRQKEARVALAEAQSVTVYTRQGNRIDHGASASARAVAVEQWRQKYPDLVEDLCPYPSQN